MPADTRPRRCPTLRSSEATSLRPTPSKNGSSRGQILRLSLSTTTVKKNGAIQANAKIQNNKGSKQHQVVTWHERHVFPICFPSEFCFLYALLLLLWSLFFLQISIDLHNTFPNRHIAKFWHNRKWFYLLAFLDMTRDDCFFDFAFLLFLDTDHASRHVFFLFCRVHCQKMLFNAFLGELFLFF